MKVLKRILMVVAIVIVAALAVVGCYAAYLELNYSRIADNQATQVEGSAAEELKQGQTYTAVTYNIGFGAYTPDYTFFMDEGYMADGTKTKGTSSWGESQQSVEACTQGDIDLLSSLNADFMLLQEVDEDSTRSYHIDQVQALRDAFPSYASTYAVSFHSSFLFYPLTQPHGFVNAGLLTLSDKDIASAVRRSYPIDESFPTKYFDLDRCFELLRLPVEGGHELVLINSHMSAYDAGGVVRAKQLTLLNTTLEEEYAKGNYVIAGGDWNHALAGSVDIYPSQKLVPDWVSVLDDADLAEGFSVVAPDNLAQVASCRGDDIPYEEGVTYTTTVDGFIVSDNVKATAENIDNGFQYSDHNPVKLSFTLLGE